MPRGIKRRRQRRRKRRGFGRTTTPPHLPTPPPFLPLPTHLPPFRLSSSSSSVVCCDGGCFVVLPRYHKTSSTTRCAGRISPIGKIYSLSLSFFFFFPPTFLSDFSFHPTLENVKACVKQESPIRPTRLFRAPSISSRTHQ